jgi:hypothetical protein
LRSNVTVPVSCTRSWPKDSQEMLDTAFVHPSP